MSRLLRWLTGLLRLGRHRWHQAQPLLLPLPLAGFCVPMRLPEGLQLAQCLKGCVEVVVNAVVTIWGNIQEELLKIWGGGQLL
jgi:hypothetical protein